MSYVAHFYLRDRYLGHSDPLSVDLWLRPRPQRSVAMFCPECGDVWGRIFVEGAPWLASHRKCPQHGGGRFWFEGSWNLLLSRLPAGLLRHELLYIDRSIYA